MKSIGVAHCWKLIHAIQVEVPSLFEANVTSLYACCSTFEMTEIRVWSLKILWEITILHPFKTNCTLNGWKSAYFRLFSKAISLFKTLQCRRISSPQYSSIQGCMVLCNNCSLHIFCSLPGLQNSAPKMWSHPFKHSFGLNCHTTVTCPGSRPSLIVS
jgi:hypothetical protein